MDQKQIVEKIVNAVSNAVAEVVQSGQSPDEVREHYYQAVYTLRAMSLVYIDHFTRRGGSAIEAEHKAQGLLETIGAPHLVPDALIHLPAPKPVQIVERVVTVEKKVEVPVEKIVEKIVEKVVYVDSHAPAPKPSKPSGRK